MIYLKKLDSHSEYEAISATTQTPSVIYDGEHSHYLKEEKNENVSGGVELNTNLD